MRNKPKNILIISMLTLSIILSSWGYNGHIIIGWNMTFSLPAEMAEFVDWNTYLSKHSSDADYRKSSDPTEGPKHYIDIDNYTDYIEKGSISQNLDSLIDKYGASFVEAQGYLPYATLTAYDSLVSKFKSREWESAKFYAADLSHYVADGFMPLHLTRNYDGQFSGNTGIHGRFESDMINRFKSNIQVNVAEIESIDTIDNYIFNYIYENYIYVDSIMAADNYGKSINSNTSSDAYLDAMWDFSKDFTGLIFNKANKAFSSLFYAAWLEAGKPLISTTSAENTDNMDDSELTFFPNPVTHNATIRFLSTGGELYKLNLLNSNGSVIMTSKENNPQQEAVEMIWDLSSFENGVYYLSLQNSGKRITKKLLLLN